MAACWRSRRGCELAATGLLLALCVASILVLSHILSVASRAPLPGRPEQLPAVAKPPLYPAPQPLLDLARFRYLLNADPCGSGDVTGVLVVTSHVEHVELRSAHRRAYPRATLLPLGLRRVFLLARPQAEPGEWAARALRDEARRFEDIVQGDFLEAYRNLTYKHTMGLQWTAKYCPQARLVIKMDDDIVADLYQLMAFLNKQPSEALTSSLVGYALRGLLPSRDPANKWFVTDTEYSAATYPDFLSGWLYATSPGVAHALVEAAARRPYFWIDDLLLTGTVREALGFGLRDASSLYTVHPEVLRCCLAEPDLRCHVLVGPNGGDNDLIVRFQAHAARCNFGQSCRDRPPGRRPDAACVVRADGDGALPLSPTAGRARQVRLF